MKKTIVWMLVSLINFILQSTVAAHLEIGGIRPNLLVIVVVACGLMNGQYMGLGIGFFSGLLTDLLFGDVIGFYALIYMVAGFLAGYFYQMFYPEDIKLPLLLIPGGNAVVCFGIYVFRFFFRGRFGFGYFLVHLIIPEILITTLAAVVVYPILLILQRLLNRWDRRER